MDCKLLNVIAYWYLQICYSPFLLGCDGDVALSSVECYHPATDKWTYVQPMACGRHAFGLVELDGWLYASGGSDFSRSEYNSLERYDPVRFVIITFITA